MSIIQFKEANCKNCYKCVRSCPVKAIAVINEQAQIVQEDCMLCGNCLSVCPQNAKSVKSDIEKVKGFINKKEKVFVSLAPSFVAAFENPNEKWIFACLKELGFIHVEETAIGAVQVSKEYEKLLIEKKMKNIITTACPSLTFLIQKYYPELIDQLAPVVSPMIAHAKMMRAIYGSRIRVVFIGPCLSKKEECNDLKNQGVIDAVITFEELEKWIIAENINIPDDYPFEAKAMKNFTCRLYPATGAILKTIGNEEKKHYKCISIDGVDRCISTLDSIKNNEVENYFLEMNSCAGGCLGGPCIKQLKGGYLKARDRLLNYTRKGNKDSNIYMVEETKVDMGKTFYELNRKFIIPNEDEIQTILNSIGKFTKDLELNCGACGYPSCRDKAVAVFNNKAQLHMCLPYMRERAESVSNLIISNTPNAIIALDNELLIQEINKSAMTMFKLDNDELIGKSIYNILNCPELEDFKGDGKNVFDQKYYYEKYNITVKQSIVHLPEKNIIAIIIKDISEEEEKSRQMFKMRSDTVEIAQKVIDKQMRVAQEIASLLGETTAETKVALTKLKKSMLAEIGDTL